MAWSWLKLLKKTKLFVGALKLMKSLNVILDNKLKLKLLKLTPLITFDKVYIRAADYRLRVEYD